MAKLVRSIRIKQSLYLGIPFFLLAAPLTSIGQQDRDTRVICHLRFATELAMLTVTVTDASGHPVANLTHHDFIVTDKKKPQQIDYFSREDGPQSVGIVLSRSVANTGAASLSSLRQSVLRFKEQSNEKNEYFMIAAGGGPQLVTDWTRDNDVLLASLDRTESADAESAGAIYDSCAAAVEKLNQRASPRSVIILITDGRDMTSRLSYTDVRETLHRSDAVVYSICRADRRMSGTGFALSDLKKSCQIARAGLLMRCHPRMR